MDAGVDAGQPDAGPLLALSQEGLDAAVELRPYSHQFMARGGAPPYAFDESATQPLPSGLTLSGAGVLSTTGLPDAGLLQLGVRVSDSDGGVASGTFQLEVKPLLRLAGPGILAEATSGETYVETFSATGGNPPPPATSYQFSWDGGDMLPGGFSLSGQGVLQGQTSQTGTFTFGVVVRDARGQVAARTVQLNVTGLNLLEVTTRSAPDGRVGWPYRYQLQKHGGGTATWTIMSGDSLPAGLDLDGAGVISGTPSSDGTWGFTVQARDGVLLNASKALSIRIER